jgi:hypothetical protein
LPVLLTVIVCGSLVVPFVRSSKEIRLRFTSIAGVLIAVEVPESSITEELPLALVLNNSEPTL